jgi:hypothetical protein
LAQKTQALEENGFPATDVFPWWRKFHSFCNLTKLRHGVDNRLTFNDYMQKAAEAGLTSPEQVGRRAHEYQMGRVGDQGHYEGDNCRFITKQQNIQEMIDNGGRERAAEKIRTGQIRERKTVSTQHVAAKPFRVTAPDGTEYIAQNVTQFAKDFGLRPEGLSQMLSGRNSNHLGWVGEYDDTPEELVVMNSMGIEVDAIVVEK